MEIYFERCQFSRQTFTKTWLMTQSYRHFYSIYKSEHETQRQIHERIEIVQIRHYFSNHYFENLFVFDSFLRKK